MIKPAPVKQRVFINLVIPVFFLAGYLLSFRAFYSQWQGYLLLTAAAGISGFLAFKALNDSEENNAAAWLVFCILLVFGYAKFYWLVLDPAPVMQFFPEGRAWEFFGSSSALLEAFRMQTMGFAAFCLSLAALLRFKKKSRSFDPARLEIPPAFLRFSSFLFFCVFLLSASLMHKYKIGLLGMASAPLPFHLSGLIFYLHTMVLPIVIVTFIYLCGTAGKYWWSRLGMLAFVLWALSDVVLRTSRASLMLVPLLVLFLALSGGIKIKKYEVLAGLGLGLLAVILSPLIWGYRICRLSGLGSLVSIISSISAFHPRIADFSKAASFIFFRVPGIETAVVVSGFMVKPLWAGTFGVLFSGKGFSWYLGHSAFGLPFDAPNGFATPFIAQWYMAGGYPGIALAAIAALFISVAAWDRLKRSEYMIAPVAGAFFLLILFWALTEGVSPYLLKQSFVAASVLFAAEFTIRNFIAVPPGKGRTGA
ncbi:MAG: hypothetical protein PHV36_01950 [Elusimicrobiales bacterium]|nr:hypothetical protein [Elusimicrobiales bacterium]